MDVVTADGGHAWRTVICPLGSAAVVSTRYPGPMVGYAGSLPGWNYAAGWTSYLRALEHAREINARRSARLANTTKS